MLPESCAMGIDSSTSLSWPTSHRRVNLTPARLRLKEERKRIIRALDAKYRTIDDHERGMRRFVLIRNNLRRLQREAREEKLSRHRANLSGSKVSNLSPSCLSATRSRSPSPPCDYAYGVGNHHSLFEDDPPAKKQRLLLFDDDNDKENEMDVDDEQREQRSVADDADEPDDKTNGSCRPVDDAQEILRDLYESCVSEGITGRSTPAPPNSSCPSDSFPPQQTSFSLSMSASCSVSSCFSNSNNSNNNSSSSSSSNSSNNNNNTSNNNTCTDNGSSDWSRHSQYPFNCGHSSLLGNDLQSVVFHSLITSLES